MVVLTWSIELSRSASGLALVQRQSQYFLFQGPVHTATSNRTHFLIAHAIAGRIDRVISSSGCCGWEVAALGVVCCRGLGDGGVQPGRQGG